VIGRRWAPPLLWAATILILTSVPVPEVDVPRNTDKLVHLVVYGILGFLVARVLIAESRARVAFLIAALAVSAYGALDEIHQAFIPGRFSDVHDWFADSIGGAIPLAYFSVRGRRARLSQTL
jgi:VanZ family protein